MDFGFLLACLFENNICLGGQRQRQQQFLIQLPLPNCSRSLFIPLPAASFLCLLGPVELLLRPASCAYIHCFIPLHPTRAPLRDDDCPSLLLQQPPFTYNEAFRLRFSFLCLSLQAFYLLAEGSFTLERSLQSTFGHTSDTLRYSYTFSKSASPGSI